MTGIFCDYVAPPDFAKNIDMAQDFVYKMGLNFLRHFLCTKKKSLFQ